MDQFPVDSLEHTMVRTTYYRSDVAHESAFAHQLLLMSTLTILTSGRSLLLMWERMAQNLPANAKST